MIGTEKPRDENNVLHMTKSDDQDNQGRQGTLSQVNSIVEQLASEPRDGGALNQFGRQNRARFIVENQEQW